MWDFDGACFAKAKPDLLRFGIEWDETSKKAICRRGIAKAEAVFPFMVTRGQLDFYKETLVRTADMIFPTVVLSGTAADDIWYGLLKAHGQTPWCLSKHAKSFVLGLTSDAAASNLNLVSRLVASKPDNSMVLHMCCLAHQNHLAASPVWVGLGFLSDMFCTSNILQTGPSSGHIWLDLLRAVEHILEKRFEVVYTPVDPDASRFARLIVENVLLAQDDDSESTCQRYSVEATERLLAIFNGDWCSTEKITHHCQSGCKAGCQSSADSLSRAKAAAIEILFGRRPTTPALSRWTACITSGRFYMLASCCHGLLNQAFQMLFPDRPAATGAGVAASMVAIHESELLTLPSSEAALHERKQRHRSTKAYTWLTSRSMTLEVTVAVFVTTPLDILLQHIFVSQSFHLHKSEDPSKLPLVELAGPRSMAKQTVDSLCNLLQEDSALCFLSRKMDSHANGDCTLSLLMHITMACLGEVHDRMVMPFISTWPWRLALIVDQRVEERHRLQTATEFFEARECCIDAGAGLFLRSNFQSDRGLFEDGQQTLQALFRQKICNIACETNFARAGAQHRAQAGKTATTPTSSEKHVLAEITAKQNEINKHVKRLVSIHPKSAKLLKPIAFNESSVVLQDSDSDNERPVSQRHNGWTLFLKQQFAANICKSRDEVQSASVGTWRANPELRRTFSARAKVQNRLAKQAERSRAAALVTHQAARPNNSDQLGDTIVAPLAEGAVSSGWEFMPVAKPYTVSNAATGDWGFGDKDYLVSHDIVQNTFCSDTKLFEAAVAEWKSKFSEPCQSQPLPSFVSPRQPCQNVCMHKFHANHEAAQALTCLKSLVRLCRKKRADLAKLKERVTFGSAFRPVLLVCRSSNVTLRGWLLSKLKLKPLGMILAGLDILETTHTDSTCVQFQSITFCCR